MDRYILERQKRDLAQIKKETEDLEREWRLRVITHRQYAMKLQELKGRMARYQAEVHPAATARGSAAGRTRAAERQRQLDRAAAGLSTGAAAYAGGRSAADRAQRLAQVERELLYAQARSEIDIAQNHSDGMSARGKLLLKQSIERKVAKAQGKPAPVCRAYGELR